MTSRPRVGVFAVVLSGAAGAAFGQAEPVTISHDAVTCLVAERYPRLEARVTASATPARVRVHFRPAGGRHWYSVAMAPEGAASYMGTLPAPRRTLRSVEYYVEATATDMIVRRTADHAPVVESGPAACQDKAAAASVTSASVTVDAQPGAPAWPEGFAPSADGGGNGRTILLAGGGALALGAALALGGGGSDAGGNPTPSSPAPLNVTGRWAGTTPDGLIVTANPICALESDLTFDLTQAGSDVTGSGTAVRRRNTDPFPTCSEPGRRDSGPVTGTLSGTAVNLRWAQNADEIFVFTGTVAGNRMSGTWTRTDARPTGTWAVTRQ